MNIKISVNPKQTGDETLSQPQTKTAAELHTQWAAAHATGPTLATVAAEWTHYR